VRDVTACRDARPSVRDIAWHTVDWRALAVAAAGLALTFSAPVHRVDLLAIGLLAAAGGLIWSPHSGPLLIGLSLPFFFFPRQLVGPIGMTPPGLALSLTWLAVIVRYRHLDLRLPRSPYGVPLALFLIAALLSLVVTDYPLLSIRELRSLILEPVVFFGLLLTMRRSAGLALAGVVIAATGTALAAVLQATFSLGGTPAEGVTRAQAWYPSANHLALLLGRTLPFAFAAALALANRWLWAIVAVLALGMLLTFSTGGWVGASAGVFVALIILGRRRLAVRLGVGMLAGLVVVMGLGISGLLPERFNPLRQTGGFRVDLWLSTLAMIHDHPVLGIGLDNFSYLYQQQYLREGAVAEPNLSHPHNWLLHVWIELGVVGVIAFVGLLAQFIRTARVALTSAGSTWLIAGAVGAMTDLLVHGLIDNSYFLVDLAFIFWLTLALVTDARIEPT
jgi:putative inorganic carbon (HCO3(-)) transporter